jgi:hypothetical protein
MTMPLLFGGVEVLTPVWIALGVNFQEVVHSTGTEEVEVAKLQFSREVRWTPIRMRL